MSRALPLLGCLLAGACGGGASEQPDAGPCPVAPLSYAWPSESDAQVCARDVLSTPEVQRTQCGDITQDCAADGVTAPALSCLTQAPALPPPDPPTVTLIGYGDVFSSGPTSNGIRLEVYRQADIGEAVTDLSQVTPIATHDFVLDATTVAEARACPTDRKDPEELHGECIQPDTGCGGCPRAVDAVDFCYKGACYGLKRWEARYSIPGIPTNTFLVLRSIGLAGGAADPRSETWAPLVQYNVYFSTADPQCVDSEDRNCIAVDDPAGPRYQFNVNLLSRSDYETIPVTAGLSAGIAAGRGAVAGEVHDCENVRLAHAQIGYSPIPLKNTYFNENPAKTLPELARWDGTSKLGLYAGLDMPPGPVHVVALGNLGGAVTLLGEFRGRVWPDTVTIIGLGGGKPPQP